MQDHEYRQLHIENQETKERKTLVFLAGTTGDNHWRDRLLEICGQQGLSKDLFFNPVVEHYGMEERMKEREARKGSSHMFTYIGDTKPGNSEERKVLGAISVAEAVVSIAKTPDSSVVVLDSTGLEGRPKKQIEEIYNLLKEQFPEAKVFTSLDEGINALFGILKK